MINNKLTQLIILGALFILTSLLPLAVMADEDKLAENTIIGYLNGGGQLETTKQSISYAYRKLLKINADGSYLIQDFDIQNERKLTDPYLIKNKADLLINRPNSIEGQITYYRTTLTDDYRLGKYKDDRTVDNYPWLRWYEKNLKHESYSLKNGQKDGLYSYWCYGQLCEQGYYQAGKATGVWTLYQDDLKEQGVMGQGKEGEWVTTDQDGQIYGKCHFLKDVPNGLCFRVNPYTARKLSETRYDNGYRQGVARQWHQNGQLASEENWEMGKREGEYKQWDGQGHLLRAGSYLADNQVGLWQYYENSLLKGEEWYFLNGKKVSRHYSVNGLLEGERVYATHGDAQTNWAETKKSWYSNGQLASREVLKQGGNYRELARWNGMGKLVFKKVYQDGRLMTTEGKKNDH